MIFSKYECKYIPSNGDPEEACTFNDDGQIPQLGEGTVRLKIKTKPCPAGYYCEAGTQTSCPGGSTSDTSDTIGAEGINDCYMDEGTQFCDSKGCFNLPGDTKIYYHGGD